MRKILFTLILFIPTLALADVSSSPIAFSNLPTSSAAAVGQTASSNFKFSGYVDGSYNNLNRNYFTSGSFDREFDLVPNGFTLQQAAITLAYQPPEGFGALLNPIAGRDVNVFAPYGFMPSSEFDSQTIAIDFPQAFLQYVKGPFTAYGGRFLALEGNEVIDPTQDNHFSRSILFYNTPDTHLGVRSVYTVNDKINLTAGINDGWDNIRDWSRRKTIELSASYKINPMVSLALTGLNGQERATPRTDVGPLGIRTLIDLIVTVNATEKLTLLANYDYGYQSKAALANGIFNRAVWQGIAGYVNYKFTEKWQISLRGEYFDDKNGFRTGMRQNWREATITLGYTPIKNVLLHAEARHDFSNVNAFTNLRGTNTSNHNQSFALEGFYKFG